MRQLSILSTETAYTQIAPAFGATKRTRRMLTWAAAASTKKPITSFNRWHLAVRFGITGNHDGFRDRDHAGVSRPWWRRYDLKQENR